MSLLIVKKYIRACMCDGFMGVRVFVWHLITRLKESISVVVYLRLVENQCLYCSVNVFLSSELP